MDERTDERTRRYRSNRGDGDARAGGRSVERARDEVLGLDREIGREEQGLLVDAPVRKSIGRESAAKV